MIVTILSFKIINMVSDVPEVRAYKPIESLMLNFYSQPTEWEAFVGDGKVAI